MGQLGNFRGQFVTVRGYCKRTFLQVRWYDVAHGDDIDEEEWHLLKLQSNGCEKDKGINYGT